ncbi:hypothetical protein FRC19_003568 [Serendipita sp. 401]|nr:hypothetical protein FRC19_003568 [Serendipita sp. 401]KAG9041254.1 hypothetical protein FS842_002626 [Serendipita sp. 407]
MKLSDLTVTAYSDEDAELLQKFADSWVTRAFSGVALAEEACQILVHFVPLTFEPKEGDAIQTLCADNRNLNLDRNQIKAARWIRGTEGSNKNKSSMVLTVTNAELADRMIDRGLSVQGSKSSGQIPSNASNANDMDTRHEPVKKRNQHVRDAPANTLQVPSSANEDAAALRARMLGNARI